MKNSTGHKRVRNIQQFFCPSTTQIIANSDCLSTLQALYSFHAPSYQPYKKSPMTKLKKNEILYFRVCLDIVYFVKTEKLLLKVR